MSALKRTPLFEVYGEYGGKTIDFGGWDLPVQFSSIKEEHEAVRERAGLFDVSHMGEFTVIGPSAEQYLQTLVTNDVSKLKVGGAQYAAMCYADGGTVDDLIIYRKQETDFLIVVNASNIEKDFDWMESHLIEGVELKNISNEVSQLAIQGPLAEQVLQKLTTTNLSEITFFKFQDEVDLQGAKALVSRTGYTGEDGFEIYCKPEDAVSLWRKILEVGNEEGTLPCGLGARDTLRFEARLPLYGQELTKDITPIEAGIGFAVKVDKESDFFGKETLKQQKEKGLERKIVGLEMIDKGIPRTGYEVFVGDTQVGFVTSGTQSPTLKKNVGLALVNIDFAPLNTIVEVQVRKKRLKAQVVKTPFYKRG
ncbi:glycine cleavage system aminomethyltransferase GcvT [Anaerobacillus alkaliphilus]|uniref:Aminomethyltransferase n=1 Tax=Anaerobacillus alkaliphilus TaxID=1548597 RepID=A0A4V1LG84_9BACI|nr:glycine cleavage system aminomethyltransferase GcvT [Anaerobacillus alkaliphilus]RXI99488.1 glycine cleavage system aminomethyltransferase GcvT [Anaerobacillus alkaliphilus]